MKIRYLVIFGTFLLIAISCKKDVYDADKFKRQTDLEVNFAGPVLKGYFLLSDLIEANRSKSDMLVVNGDTVKFHIKRDSIFTFDASELTIIPPQIAADYTIHGIDIPGPIMALLPEVFDNPLIAVNKTFTLALKNSMRLDSLLMNKGQLVINVENTFKYSADIIISSTSILDKSNKPLQDTLKTNSNPTASYSIELSGYKVIFGHTVNDSSTINIAFKPRFHRNGHSDPVSSSEYVKIGFNITGLNDFGTFFGFVGFYQFSYDTTVNFAIEGAKDVMNKLKGTFQVTNPIIRIYYKQTFGVPLGVDLNFDIYHGAVADATMDFLPKILPQVESYKGPPIESNLAFTKADGIDKLVSFPVADSLHIVGTVMTNMGVTDPANTYNFVDGNSKVILGLDVEVPLEFRADLTYTDTIEFKPDNNLKDIDFDTLTLHYWFANGFPLGFNATLYLYNDTIKQNIDSVALNLVKNEPFLKPAKVDNNGIVIQSQVEEVHGYTTLDLGTAENLLNHATHFIVKARILSTNLSSVMILQTSKLNFQFAIDAKGRYIKKF